MAKYETCEFCGSNLDFGEHCDCQNESSVKPRETPYDRTLKAVAATGNKWAMENFLATHS